MIHIQPAKSRVVPEVDEATPDSSASFPLGAPLQRVSGTPAEIEEHAGGATVTGLIGFALQAVASGTPDFGDKAQFARARQNMEFMAQVFDVSASAVATVAGDGTYLGNDYGLIKNGGEWYVDEEDTTDVMVTVTAELPEINAVLFKVITSAIED